jgi:hypothetical protein
MQTITVEKEQTLKANVQKSLSTMFNRYKNPRCHEIARFLEKDLCEMGYSDTVVRDGSVEYTIDFLRRDTIDYLREKGNEQAANVLEEEKIKLKCAEGRTPRIRHSWLEVENIVVDYHNYLEASKDLSLEGLLIVKRKHELNGAFYYVDGRAFKIFGMTFIYYLFPLDLVKIRI